MPRLSLRPRPRAALARAAALVVLCALQLLANPCRAAGGDPDLGRAEPPALDLAAATRVPLSVGPELGVELPGRLLLQAHLGWMPELYSNTLTGALKGAGAYDAAVATLIDTSLERVTALRLVAGWRPFRSAGLELFGGYTRISLTGATSTGEVLPRLSREAAERVREEIGSLDLRLESTLHAFTAGAGWRWLIADRVVVRASVEYLQAFASRSTLTIGSSDELTRQAAPAVQALLDRHYLEYIRVPLVGLCVGYRFF